METLDVLFENKVRLRLMRFLILHRGEYSDIQTIAEKLSLSSLEVRREIKVLLQAVYIKQKMYTKKIVSKKGVATMEKVDGYARGVVDNEEKLLDILLMNTGILSSTSLQNTFKKMGTVDFVSLSGSFVGNSQSDIDITIVGSLKKIKTKAEEQIQKLEEEFGVDVRYALFDTEDFLYRYKMHDKFVVDIVSDVTNRVIVDTISI